MIFGIVTYKYTCALHICTNTRSPCTVTRHARNVEISTKTAIFLLCVNGSFDLNPQNQSKDDQRQGGNGRQGATNQMPMDKTKQGKEYTTVINNKI